MTETIISAFVTTVLFNGLFALFLKHLFDKKIASYTSKLNLDNEVFLRNFEPVQKAVINTRKNLLEYYRAFEGYVSEREEDERPIAVKRYFDADDRFYTDYDNDKIYLPKPLQIKIARFLRLIVKMDIISQLYYNADRNNESEIEGKKRNLHNLIDLGKEQTALVESLETDFQNVICAKGSN